MNDETRQLKKEIIRLRSLCRAAADEILRLDNIINDFTEGNSFPPRNEDDLWGGGEASVNLLSRLDGGLKGDYINNYEDLRSEMLALDENYRRTGGKWYGCARCDAGYDSGPLEQECVCEDNEL